MADQERVDHELPVDILQSVLRTGIGDRTATITGISAALLPNQGNSGNQLFRADVTWTGQMGPAAASWVVKHWRPGGFTSAFMDIRVPLEALAWEHGLLQSAMVPDGLAIPFVGATIDEAGDAAWIVMEDVGDDLDALSESDAADDRTELARIVLDRMARWHAAWERPDCQATLAACPWLTTQETRLRCGADTYASCLEDAPQPVRPIPPLMTEVLCPPTRDFLAGLPKAHRRTWRTLLHQRNALIEACADLPQTLIHGDLWLGNAGIGRRAGDREVVLIDWEWIGRGSAAFDVRLLIASIAGHGHMSDAARTLADHYFHRYRTHGGSRMDRSMRALMVAGIFEAVRVFPFFAGGALNEDSRFYGWADAATISARIDEATEAMGRWLGRV